jgi:hypothetical protein
MQPERVARTLSLASITDNRTRIARESIGVWRPRSLRCLPLVALGLSSCMLTPTDDARVDSSSSTLSLSGYHIDPEALVQVRAKEFATNQMVNVGAPARSSSTVSGFATRPPVYLWSAALALDSRFWRAGPNAGQCAVLDATTESAGQTYNLITVESDWLYCHNRTRGELLHFANQCASNNSPVAKIYTRDWGLVPIPLARLTAAGRLATVLMRLTLDNYTPTAHAFCSSATPDGCPPGVSLDPEMYKFYQPNGSFIRHSGTTLSFSITPSRSNPMTVYIDDMSSTDLEIRAEGSSLMLGINFENSGTEIRMDCIRDIRCPAAGARTIDFAAPRAELRFQLAPQNGRIGYSHVTTTFTSGTPGDDADQASAAIAEAFTQKLLGDTNIRNAVSNALYELVVFAANLSPFTVENAFVSASELQVQAGCPTDR